MLAVGGTSLTANPVTGAYVSETALNTLPEVIDGHSGRRVADSATCSPGPRTRTACPASAPSGACRTLPGTARLQRHGVRVRRARRRLRAHRGGGTSAAAPFWAGLIALADQEAGHPLGFVNPAIYRIARGPLYHKAFHDITTGNNTVVLNGVTITGYQAGPGWDPVTGWGTPDAEVLIPLLAH